MMTEDERKAMEELDELAEEAGGYVMPIGHADDVHYNYRAILNYCKQQGKEPIDLTIREMQQFVVHP